MNCTICVDSSQPVLRFAAGELGRYLGLATGAHPGVATTTPTNGTPCLTLTVLTGPPLPEDADAEDDWIVIKPAANGYVLGGSNPRSVLIAVYRYLRELGCRWLRPGAEHEIVPRLDSPMADGLDIVEKASYRYRTLCIEGGCSVHHVTDLIDWAVKHGMNGYFLQFDYGTCFWQRWYEHLENPLIDAPPFTQEDAVAKVAAVMPEIERRGLKFERMGHGWTGRALGITAESWEAEGLELADEQRPIVAELNGERELFGGQPLNTNLCYGNPELRASVVADIVGYAKDHPQVDLLHLWLADGTNNHCECEVCREQRPSDWYVRLLNELDAALAAADLKTRIVFLIYVDLLWPPLEERFQNPERFVLMFAPITRSYQSSFDEAAVHDGALPEFARNKLEFPKEVGVNLAFLKAWQDLSSHDAFDFDYHLIWAPSYDPNHYALAHILHRDIKHLANLGLDGLNSCQCQRVSFPHNLLQDVLARTLWDRELPFERLAAESFGDAYGDNGQQVAAFFQEMSELWSPFFEAVHTPEPDPERIAAGLANIERMRPLMESIGALVKPARQHPEPAVRWSWEYLEHYLALLELQLPAFEAYLRRDANCEELFEKFFAELWRVEPQVHQGLDVHMAIKVYRWRLAEVAEAE